MYMEISLRPCYLEFVLAYSKPEKGISPEFSSFMTDFFFAKLNAFKGYVRPSCTFENINVNIS